MRIVAALGGNALLERGEKPDAAIQHRHIRRAAAALAPLTREHEVIITHGNGPQVGLLAIESEGDPALSEPYPLDVLGAQTQGMIGYWLTQELHNLGVDRPIVGLLTQTIVDSNDPAFAMPTKFVGATYDHSRALQLATDRRWTIAADGPAWRRVVASPRPQRMVEIEMIRLLVDDGVVVVCAGGGGAPVIEDGDGRLTGVAAVVDKDLTAALLAESVDADLLMLLTDVRGIISGYGTSHARKIHSIDSARLAAQQFPSGSMGPKVEACVQFVDRTGHRAAIGSLTDAAEIVTGRAGTTITPGAVEGIRARAAVRS